MGVKNEVSIKYRRKLSHRGEIDGDPYMEWDYDYVKASTDNVKRFSAALMLLMGISGCERVLMDWIEDNMTGGNYISNNDVTRRNFIQFYHRHKKSKNKVYSEKTVSIAFQRLSDCGLLVSVSRGTFMVNPLYFYSGDERSRINAIKMIMEFKSGVETRVTVEKSKR